MRNALILVRRHGEPPNSRELFSDPSVPIADTISQFKQTFCLEPTHADYNLAELWESNSGIARLRHLQPTAAPEPSQKKGKK